MERRCGNVSDMIVEDSDEDRVEPIYHLPSVIGHYLVRFWSNVSQGILPKEVVLSPMLGKTQEAWQKGMASVSMNPMISCKMKSSGTNRKWTMQMFTISPYHVITSLSLIPLQPRYETLNIL